MNCEVAKIGLRADLVELWSLLAVITDPRLFFFTYNFFSFINNRSCSLFSLYFLFSSVYDEEIQSSKDWLEFGLSEFERPWTLNPFAR